MEVSNRILTYGFGSALGYGLSAAVDLTTAADAEDAEEDEFRAFVISQSILLPLCLTALVVSACFDETLSCFLP